MRETVALEVIRQVLYLTTERPPAKEVVKYAYDVADEFIRLGESHTAVAAQRNHEDRQREK